jgi:hypothetical protein
MRTICKLTLLLLLAMSLLASSALPQSDLPEMKKWMDNSTHPGTIPENTKVSMKNWQEYKQFMPLGMVELFQGRQKWRMPPNVEIIVGPTEHDLLPRTYLEATERHSLQTKVVRLPNGRIELQNYHGGIPFSNPQEPDMGYKILANLFFSYVPHLYVNGPENTGTLWFQDRFGNISAQTLGVVYRQSGWNTDPGIPADESYAPGTWYTEWSTVEAPEQSKYTSLLSLFFKDQQANPFPDTYVYVPALRRSLRLSVSARCSPVYGSDWTNDDAKTIGFNGGTSMFDAVMLGERKILALIDYNQKYASFPANWQMPLGFPRPSWGKWQLRDVYVIDVRRIPTERLGYCYGSRIMYVDKEFFYTLWNDLYDSNMKLWKTQFWGPKIRSVPQLGRTITNVVGAATWDLQNSHASYWSSAGNLRHLEPHLNENAPVQFHDGVKYGSPSGLMQIMK